MIKEKLSLKIWLLIASVLGIWSSAKLLLSKISYWQQEAEGREAVLGCDLNPIVGCGKMINSEQASIFWDIPNPLIGVIGFSALLALTVIIFTNTNLPKWMWIGLQLGVTFGLAVTVYLQYSSLYVLGGLCPYCFVVWLIMIPAFWGVTIRNLKEWLPDKKIASMFYNWTGMWIGFHFIILFTLIWLRFGETIWA